MAKYRLTYAAQADIVSILAWSQEQFGDEARERYQALIATAIRDASSRTGDVGRTARSSTRPFFRADAGPTAYHEPPGEGWILDHVIVVSGYYLKTLRVSLVGH